MQNIYQEKTCSTEFALDQRELHGHPQMVNIEIRLIIYSLQVKTEKLYTVSKNKTVAQIMNSLLPNSDLN